MPYSFPGVSDETLLQWIEEETGPSPFLSQLTGEAKARGLLQECRDCGKLFPFTPDADICPACVTASLGENAMSEAELIEQASRDLGETVNTVLDACELFYLNGFADEQAGDVAESGLHYYRVHRWIVQTDSQGFHDLFTFDTEREAESKFTEIADAL